MTNGLQNRCSTTELSRRREEPRAFSSRQLYRSEGPQSTDDCPCALSTMQGTGPPGLQMGRGGLPEAAALAAESPFCPGAAVAVAAGSAAGTVAAGQACTLIGLPAPAGTRSETSFSGTATALLASVRSSQ